MHRKGWTLQRRFSVVLSFLLALMLGIIPSFFAATPVRAAGNEPSHVKAGPSDPNQLHGGFKGYKQGVKNQHNISGRLATSTVTLSSNIVFLHGISGSDSIKCSGYGGLWTNPMSYLGATHVGLNGDSIRWTGVPHTVGFYANDTNCSEYIDTRAHGYPYATACNGYYVSNNDSLVGTRDEPLEHVSCELAWFIYNGWSKFSANVKVVAHSMGGLIVRYAIAKAGTDSHFPPYLYISDVVTMSTPHGGLTSIQFGTFPFQCNRIADHRFACWQFMEMVYENNNQNPFMGFLINQADHPQARNGTDWTMMGSLSDDDPLNWFWQSTYQSGSHRLGYGHRNASGSYDGTIQCSNDPNHAWYWPNGYDHGDYVNDGCDDYNAPQYYCDGCNRDSQTYYYTTAAPHSLHNMLLAFVYINW